MVLKSLLVMFFIGIAVVAGVFVPTGIMAMTGRNMYLAQSAAQASQLYNEATMQLVGVGVFLLGTIVALLSIIAVKD